MKLVSLNVGQPRVIETTHGEILTSIFKEAVSGRRKVAQHNIEGDRQSDLTVHGGPRKAVYAYAHHHYDFWSHELGDLSLTPGMFGENLTIDGLDEADIHIGDLIAIGTAELRVTEPRMPCFKLALRFDRSDMVKRFWKSGRSGVYFAVEKAGDLGSGDAVRVVETNPLKVSIAQVVKLFQGIGDQHQFERVMASPLQGGWRKGIYDRWTQIS